MTNANNPEMRETRDETERISNVAAQTETDSSAYRRVHNALFFFFSRPIAGFYSCLPCRVLCCNVLSAQKPQKETKEKKGKESRHHHAVGGALLVFGRKKKNRHQQQPSVQTTTCCVALPVLFSCCQCAGGWKTPFPACFADGSPHYFDKGHFPKWFSW